MSEGLAAKVRLRPVSRDDLAIFEAELFDPEGVGPYQWFGYRSKSRVRAEFEETFFLDCSGGRLTIEFDGGVAGRVQWREARWGPPDTPSCWELGVVVFTAYRNRGIGTEAQRQLVDYLFNTTTVFRIQAYVDAANAPELAVLNKLGFTQEGVVRAAQWRSGTWHDQVVFSILRHEWKQLHRK